MAKQDTSDEQVTVVNQGTSLIFAATFIAAITVDQFAGDARPFSGLIYGLLVGIGVAQAVAYASFGLYAKKNALLRAHQARIDTVALFASLPYVSWQVWATDGIERPYWALFVLPCVMGGLALSTTGAMALAGASGVCVLLATAASSGVQAQDAGALVFVTLLLLTVGWYCTSIGNQLRSLQQRAREDQANLQARVEELSTQLGRAARGDLSTEVQLHDGNEALHSLAGAFNETLKNT